MQPENPSYIFFFNSPTNVFDISIRYRVMELLSVTVFWSWPLTFWSWSPVKCSFKNFYCAITHWMSKIHRRLLTSKVCYLCRLIMVFYVIGQTIIFMVALCNRADHYIFALWFLSIFFLSIFFYSSPNLSGRRLDVCHTSTHGVALVRI